MSKKDASWSKAHRWLVETGNPELKSRIEKIAGRLYHMQNSGDQNNNARIANLKTELCLCCMQYFSVQGIGMNGEKCDGAFFEALEKTIDSFNPHAKKEKGDGPASFVVWMKQQYRFKRLDAEEDDFEWYFGPKPTKHDNNDEPSVPKLVPLDDFPVSQDQNKYLLDYDDIVLEDDDIRLMSGMYVNLLELVCQFLNHVEDKRTYTKENRLTRKMVFSEMLTRMVKTAEREHLGLFSGHGRDTLQATEIGFVDCYMKEPYIADGTGEPDVVAFLWNTGIREFVMGVVQEDDGFAIREVPVARVPTLEQMDTQSSKWQLPGELFIKYYDEYFNLPIGTYGKDTVSHWRAAFYKLIDKVRES